MADMDQEADDWLGGWQPADDLPHAYREALHWLLAGYQRSYEPYAAEQDYLQAAGGDDDPYDGPFHRTSGPAHVAAEHHRAQADAYRADLPAARAAREAASARLEALRRELARTYPWQRSKRTQLRDQISDAEDLIGDCCDDVNRCESGEEYSSWRGRDAAEIAARLRRYERAHHAASRAASQAAGWPATRSPATRTAHTAAWPPRRRYRGPHSALGPHCQLPACGGAAGAAAARPQSSAMRQASAPARATATTFTGGGRSR